ncbi:32 kDa beta-galactoside-binding lectin-like [Daphnia pulicaria]|uniref:32 kDa beta-galactoside-binding lectin-like n=1 Tax=Daphnia pulicaria TaxID=35523 RepID=UPI001EEA3301|nr:32 kDa beta-galactoside-binding lectin-like [Daphnia pulicaria]
MSRTISLKHPEVPVAHQISDGKLEIGDKVELKGEPLEHAERFMVNFVDKSTHHCVFHLDFRFNEGDAYHKAVVRNSNYPHGHWGAEERSDNPLQRGKPFKIQIKVLADRFNVEVDDSHHFDFNHRVSLGDADLIEIKGDVKIKSVKIKEC